MPWSLVAEWVGAFGSLIAGIGSLSAALVALWIASNANKAALRIASNANKAALRIASNANKVALRIASNANKAKLKGKCKIVNRFIIPESEIKFSEISLKMTNTGPHLMVIRHIEMWVGKEQAKQGENDAVKSRKESEDYLFGNTFEFIKPPDILNPEPSDMLQVGKSCVRFIPCNFAKDEKDALDSLREVVRNKKEAKTVRFAVYTDYGRFFLKSEKCVVKAIIDAITQKD